VTTTTEVLVEAVLGVVAILQALAVLRSIDLRVVRERVGRERPVRELPAGERR
jgi:hypothetical protein